MKIKDKKSRSILNVISPSVIRNMVLQKDKYEIAENNIENKENKKIRKEVTK